jgi:hypothetical protein
MPTGSDGIFLSYRRDDADEAASLLQVSLGLFLPGTPVFRDSSSIMPGDEWRTEIDDRLRSSAVLLALIGPGWLTAEDEEGNRRLDDPDDVLAGEIALALNLGMPVIPVLVKDAQMPSAEQLPQRLRELAGKQFHQLPYHRNLPRYLQDVQWLAPHIGELQVQSARARQAREQAPGDRQILDSQTPIPEFAAQIRRIRAGESPFLASPAHAMESLRVFAQQRPIAELVGLRPTGAETSGFAPLDVVAILTLAVVDRSAAEAAELAVGLRRAELDDAAPGPAGLTKRIIHDLAAQRTVPGVAEFIAECKRRGEADPAQESPADFTVRETRLAFIRSPSRASLDKALLYFELLRFDCADEADALLAEALSAEKPPSGVIGEVGIVGAFRHLSPAQPPIVEDWLSKRVKTVANRETTANLVANLLRNEPGGDRALAEHVGRTWPATPLIQLCEALANEAGSESPGLRLVRRYLATRDADVLADVMGQWYQSESTTLRGTFPRLLTEIVTCPERLATTNAAGNAAGEDNPEERGLPFLNSLRTALKRRGTPPRCRSELLVAAATHIEHRSGAEAAELLGWIARPVWWREARSDQWRAAQTVNAWFAEGLATREVGTEPYNEHLKKLVDYLKNLQGLPDARKLIFWAVRELTDPTTLKRYRLRGGQLGDIAVRIYADGLSDAAFDLLERYLENEQVVTPTDVTHIVAAVRDDRSMRKDSLWEELLGGTIGRWTDTSRMKEVLDQLANEYPDEVKAIMSLSQ